MSSYKIVLETEREMDAAATFLWWRLLLSIAPEVSHENPYCGLQFTLTLHNVIDVDTFIWHTTMCSIMTLLWHDVLVWQDLLVPSISLVTTPRPTYGMCDKLLGYSLDICACTPYAQLGQNLHRRRHCLHHRNVIIREPSIHELTK